MLTLQTRLDELDLAYSELLGFGDEEISAADAAQKLKLEHAIKQVKAELAKVRDAAKGKRVKFVPAPVQDTQESTDVVVDVPVTYASDGEESWEDYASNSSHAEDEAVSSQPLLPDVDTWEEHVEDFRANSMMAIDAAYKAYSTCLRGETDNETALRVLDNTVDGLNNSANALSRSRDYVMPKGPLDELSAHRTRAMSVIMGYRDALLGNPGYFHNAQAWDALIPDDERSPLTVPPTDVQQELLRGIQFKMDFGEKPEMCQKASHVVMNSSAVVTACMVFMKAAKFARAAAVTNPKANVCVVDVGSGYNGVQALKMLARNRANVTAGLYYHAMIPQVDEADKARIEKLHVADDFTNMNYLPSTRQLVSGRISYCHHKLSECSCLKHFDVVKAVSNHVMYYFRQADYENLFQHTSAIDCACHIPKVGETIPCDAPEYEWLDAKRHGSMLQRLKSRFRESVTGVPEVVMRPLKQGETTYRHVDIGYLIEKGGMHVSSFSRQVEDVVVDGKVPWKALKTWAMGSVAPIATGALIGGVLGGLAAGVSYVAATASAAELCATLACHRRFNTEAPWEADHTVRMRVVSSYGTPAGEELAHVVRVTCEAPSDLVPGLRESVQIDPAELPRATSALAMAGDNRKSRLHVAATLVRDGVNTVRVKHTVTHAARLVNYLDSYLSGQPPWQSSRQLPSAFIFLLPALAATQKLTSQTTALLRPHMMRYGVTALSQLSNSTLFPVICFLLWLGPLYLAACWVGLRLWALAVRD